MEHFSEESKFIAENWQTVQDILAAAEAFEEEIRQLFMSLEDDVRDEEWWDDNWRFGLYGSADVNIGREEWAAEEGAAGSDNIVTIGLRKFGIDTVVGHGAGSAEFYVYVKNGWTELSEALVDAIAAHIADLPQGHTLGSSSTRIVTAPLRKCLPGMIEDYPELAKQQALEFFGLYAPMLFELNDLIQKIIRQEQ